ncbi:hypothetical protein P9112_009085 [Eukaryota sp. TZLM1-RC]
MSLPLNDVSYSREQLISLYNPSSSFPSWLEEIDEAFNSTRHDPHCLLNPEFDPSIVTSFEQQRIQKANTRKERRPRGTPAPVRGGRRRAEKKSFEFTRPEPKPEPKDLQVWQAPENSTSLDLDWDEDTSVVASANDTGRPVADGLVELEEPLLPVANPNPNPNPISNHSTEPAKIHLQVPQKQDESQPSQPPGISLLNFEYVDSHGNLQGPYASPVMQRWYQEGFLPQELEIRINNFDQKSLNFEEKGFVLLSEWIDSYGSFLVTVSPSSPLVSRFQRSPQIATSSVKDSQDLFDQDFIPIKWKSSKKKPSKPSQPKETTPIRPSVQESPQFFTPQAKESSSYEYDALSTRPVSDVSLGDVVSVKISQAQQKSRESLGSSQPKPTKQRLSLADIQREQMKKAEELRKAKQAASKVTSESKLKWTAQQSVTKPNANVKPQKSLKEIQEEERLKRQLGQKSEQVKPSHLTLSERLALLNGSKPAPSSNKPSPKPIVAPVPVAPINGEPTESNSNNVSNIWGYQPNNKSSAKPVTSPAATPDSQSNGFTCSSSLFNWARQQVLDFGFPSDGADGFVEFLVTCGSVKEVSDYCKSYFKGISTDDFAHNFFEKLTFEKESKPVNVKGKRGKRGKTKFQKIL